MGNQTYKTRKEKIGLELDNKINFRILSGSSENWRRGIADAIWGVRKGLKSSWDKLMSGDVLIFYVTSPISGVIGFGRLETKFKQDKPLWPDEVIRSEVIYPFRFEFKIDFVLPEREWKKKTIKIGDLKLNYWAGVNFVKNQEAIKTLNERIKEKWNVSLPLEEIVEKRLVREKVREYKVTKFTHRDIQEALKEIGELQGFFAEIEYPMENEKLDVVWRKVVGAVPTYVFEVQIGGDVYHALGKLKHAWDIWNSNIFLVADKKSFSKVGNLLSGTFHEISHLLKKFTPDEVQELYEHKTKVKKLEQRFGISKI